MPIPPETRLLWLAELRPDIERAVGKWIRETHDRDDVVQTTMLVGIGGVFPGDTKDGFRSWLSETAYRQTKNLLRKRHKAGSREVSYQDFIDEPAVIAPDRLEQVEAEQIEERAVAAVAQHLHKSPGDGVALAAMLAAREGVTLEETAKARGVPATRVRKQVSRTRRTLQRVVFMAAAVVAIFLIGTEVARRGPGGDNHFATLPGAQTREQLMASAVRRAALAYCDAERWDKCTEYLDDAKKLDPAGEGAEEVMDARRRVAEAMGAGDGGGPR